MLDVAIAGKFNKQEVEFLNINFVCNSVLVVQYLHIVIQLIKNGLSHP